MKLEKAINALKQKQAIIARTDDDHWLYEPIATVLEELETYKKALELACEYFGDFLCWDKSGEEIDCSDKICEKCWKEYYMQKARKENDT